MPKRKMNGYRNQPFKAPRRTGYKRTTRKATFRPGYDRTGGYYGRFAGPSGELKFFDTDLDDAVVVVGMAIYNLTIVPEGNGESDRIGRKMTIKRIHIRGNVSIAANATMANSSDTVIGMLVQDTQTNGAQYTAADLLDTDSFKSFRNLANSKRFKILHKVIFDLKVGGAAPSGAALLHGEDVISINVNKNVSIPIEYDNSANTGVITSVRTNNLYWVTQSSAGVSSIIANARIRYTD